MRCRLTLTVLRPFLTLGWKSCALARITVIPVVKPALSTGAQAIPT
jgi:hypothetical protein